MARKKKEKTVETSGPVETQIKSTVEPCEQGIISRNAKTVIVNTMIETIGQIRFGDGTEVNLTITEKDLIPTSDGKFVEKVVFAGSKRRGVDRRTIHALRNQVLSQNGINRFERCYIPDLCRKCPTCWLFGATAMGEGYNIKSRILYGSAYSIEPSEIAVQPHSRNMVNEQTQTTAGEAGIHTEEFIKGGVHFPVITTLEKVVDWEIGAFAHALLENINQNKYTAASRSQGGVKFSEDETMGHGIIIDESPIGIFPLPTPKIGAGKTNLAEAIKIYQENSDLEEIKKKFEAQGFKVDYSKKDSGEEDKKVSLIQTDSSIIYEIKLKNKGILEIYQDILKEKKNNAGEVIKDETGNPIIEHECKLLQTRYFGDIALGYLKEKQHAWKTFLETFDQQKWKTTNDEILKKIGLTKTEKASEESTGESTTEESAPESEETN
jgi:hypothetical protein